MCQNVRTAKPVACNATVQTVVSGAAAAERRVSRHISVSFHRHPPTWRDWILDQFGGIMSIPMMYRLRIAPAEIFTVAVSGAARAQSALSGVEAAKTDEPDTREIRIGIASKVNFKNGNAVTAQSNWGKVDALLVVW